MITTTRQFGRSAIHQQIRTKYQATHDDLRPRGQLGRGKPPQSGSSMSLGCVLERKIIDYNYGAPLWNTIRNKFKCWFLLQDSSRRRSDLGPDGLKQIYTIYKQAMIENNLKALQSVLTVYEFHEIKQLIVDKKKTMTAKEIANSNKIKAVIDIKKLSYASYEVLEAPEVEVSQLNVQFTSTIVTSSPLLGDQQEEVVEYVTFEFSQKADSAGTVVLPLRIAGSYDTQGDRIGKDTSDRRSLKSRMAMQIDQQEK